MLIHFICVGNTHRSRLAEALVNARRLPGVTAGSSGIRAGDDENGPISWYAARLLKNAGLLPYASRTWTQTTPELIRRADLVIFLERSCFDHCSDVLGCSPGAYEVWEVPDLHHLGFHGPPRSFEDEIERIRASEETFAALRGLVDALLDRYAETAPDRDYLRELRALVGHRPLVLPGSLVVIVDGSGRVLLQHRAVDGRWGLPGGFTEPGETLEETARRETLEETGIALDDLTFLTVLSGREQFYQYPNGDQVFNVTAVYTARGPARAPRLSNHETLELRYVSCDELPESLIVSSRRAIEAYRLAAKA